MSERSQQLFSFLLDISQNLEQAASLFEQSLDNLADPVQLAVDMKALEAHGDELTNALTSLLKSSYVMPLEREDFLALAVHMDDIVDGLEACTVRFDVYGVSDATPVMREFAANIVESVKEIAQAMQKLRAHDYSSIREHTLRLSQLEKTGDLLLRNSLRILFKPGSYDALSVIKLKEIYEILEGVTDKCNAVGDVLDSVTLKNA
ncbi:DUF47 family protein [Alicyclobacillus tolerans]|uniref:DUF47 domain-containing protein n=1 Tax=Alicyclobacillus tolerans TaxID=90970 RepID=UPI001F47FBA2|nr:DUF47 family protein [Alicyclobacillus tolerans]MCF8563509.1 DUF47 family protein [Alicyclobacillus tolerans]